MILDVPFQKAKVTEQDIRSEVDYHYCYIENLFQPEHNLAYLHCVLNSEMLIDVYKQWHNKEKRDEKSHPCLGAKRCKIFSGLE